MFSKVDKIKSIDDFRKTTTLYLERTQDFFRDSRERFNNSDDYVKFLVTSYYHNEIDEKYFVDELSQHCSHTILNDYLFMLGIIDFEKFEREKIRISLEESLSKIEKVDSFVDMYNQTEENIRRNYERKVNALNFRLGKVGFIEHEIEDATLLDQPYAKVFFTPSAEEDSKLEIDVRFNRIFIDRLSKREGYSEIRDEEGNLKEDSIIEEWFQTAVIVLAANMLKESDIDFFRSLASEDPGAELVQRLEFDPEEIPEEYREQAQDFIRHKGIYK